MRRVDERGSALLVALGMLVLLSIMGVTFVILSRMEMQAAINFDNVTRARFLAETGLERALAELRTLYAGPVFRPRFSGTPPTLAFRIERPYSATVAAHPSETWGARAIRLDSPATYTSLETMVMPDPVSMESASYLWSGARRGRLSDGYFDARFRGVGRLDTASNPYVDASTGQTFRIVRGVVDLSGLVNVNSVDVNSVESRTAKVQLLRGLLVYFGFADADALTTATAIVNSRQNGGPFRYVRELVDRGILTGEDANGNGVLDPGEDTNGNGVLDVSPQLYGEDANGNGILDPGEDTNGNGVLDGALRDAITVFPMTGVSTVSNSAINVNTAPEPVLFAVFYPVLSNDSVKALNLARAVIAYRAGWDPAGWDNVEGAVSERDPNGDGTPNPTSLTPDGDTDDLYCDDNPFDGIFDQTLHAFINSAVVATWLPEFASGVGEWQDIDGDTVPPERVAGTSRTFDRWLFPDGPGGFSEFEYFMDNLATWFPTLGLTQQEIDSVKYNATPRDDPNLGYATPPPLPPAPRRVTAAFRYDSERWLIISEGRVERGGELQATVTLSSVVAYQ
jgi:hypothetical protein